MSATGMWQINATALTVLIILNMALSQTPEALWIAVLFAAALLGACGIAADQLIRRRKKKEKAPDGTRQAE